MPVSKITQRKSGLFIAAITYIYAARWRNGNQYGGYPFYGSY
jgi:hypothetical protein